MILTKWQALKDIEKEDMLSSLYIKNGPFSNFLKANEDRRKKILSDIMCEENYNELLKAKNYNDKLLKSYSTSYKEMKLSKDDDYVVFKNRINSLITQKSNVITDILIELLDSNDIKDIYSCFD